MKLSDYVSEKQILIGGSFKKKRDALKELVSLLIKNKKVSVAYKDKVLSSLLAREKLGSTAIGKGVALPHARLDFIKKPLLVISVSTKGVDFDSLDGELVSVIFMILSPKSLEGSHVKLMAVISRLLRDKFFLERLKNVSGSRDLKKLIAANEKPAGKS